MGGDRNSTSTRRGRPPRCVRDDTGTATSREDLVDVLATTLLAQLLDDPACVNQTDASPWSDADSSLALPSEASPDAVTERGRVDPARPHRTGRTT
jgi:hypothetical protein